MLKSVTILPWLVEHWFCYERESEAGRGGARSMAMDEGMLGGRAWLSCSLG